MKFDYQWFWQNFGLMLKKFTVIEKSLSRSQFGYSKKVEFEIEGKIEGYVTIYSTGALNIEVLDGNYDTLLNVLIVNQNENTNKEKEDAFEKLMKILTQFASSE